MVDPVPELPGAHANLALGHADVGERLGELRAGYAGERGEACFRNRG